ncbi:esterase-like activity of phytase family protein [Variovorax sp. J22P168]|uniref:esterase-like activity of phytase family protein n=1 Tax=Variovorax jilinensis TaxID=3053513 RepID=UPI002577051B|nr:esterase-like activity of phytase family protein [Variovorax sp. J22P168]MDM0013585.1 esterase-like activity of phytase family protein [Variovorax sp. J22P168]
MNEKRSRVSWVMAVGASLVVAACGGGGSGGSFTLPAASGGSGVGAGAGAGAGAGGTSGAGDTVAAKSVSGVFLDAAVEGLDYVAGSSPKAVTNAKGEFACKEGETVAFSLGALALGSAACGSTLTPLSLANLQATPESLKADAVVNRLVALQGFDEDGDPSNGIRIGDALKAALKANALDFGAAGASFDAAFNALMASLPGPYATRVSDAARRSLAREHFENTLTSQTGIALVESAVQTHALGSIALSVSRHQMQADTKFNVPYEGSNAKIRAQFPNGFLPAYGSGLAFKGTAADGALEFYAITDRGPNGDGPTAPTPGGTGTSISKVFPAPSFAPSFGLVTIGRNGAVLQSSTPLRLDASRKLTGLPPQSGVGATGETPLDDTYVYDAAKAGFDANGLDPESLVLDRARNVLWSSDEYGPFIVRIDIATGVVQKRYSPGSGAADLPLVLAQRRPNRGMEGLTLDVASGRLHGFLQSPIDPRDSAGKSIKAKPPGGSNTDVRHLAKFTRWLEFDPTTERSKLYAYPIDGSQYDKDRTGNAKLGDVVSLGNGRFIVIEQGARKSDGRVFNKLVLVEIPANATDIAALDHNLEISSITQAASAGADWSSVVTLRKTDLLDLNAIGWMAEKAEGLTLVEDHTLALVNDNDFGLATTLLDANGQRVAGSVEDCTVDAAGAIVSGCPAGVAGAQLVRGSDLERPTRLWLLRFERKLTGLQVPAS